MKVAILLLLAACVFGLQTALPPRNCPGCNPPGTKPPAPTPSTNTPPDFALQFKPPLGLQCLPAAALAAVTARVKMQIPNADVRTVCAGGRQNIGIYRTQPTKLDPASARNVGTSQISILQGSETFAMNVAAAGYMNQVAAIWSTFPKAFTNGGVANPSGPVFLSGYYVSFGSDTITLQIDGNTQGISFHLVSSDVLSIQGGKISCANSVDLNIDKSFLDVLLGLAFGFAPIFAPYLVDLEQLAATYSSQGSTYLPGEAKCSLGAVIPNDIPLSYPPLLVGQKVDFVYSRLSVSAGSGVSVGGTFAIIPRSPSFTVDVNPPNLRVDFESPATAALTLEPVDMLPPFTLTWTAPQSNRPSGTAVFSGNSTFPTLALMWSTLNKGFNTRVVSLTLTDVDGLKASQTLTLSIDRTPTGDPPACSGPKGRLIPGC